MSQSKKKPVLASGVIQSSSGTRRGMQQSMNKSKPLGTRTGIYSMRNNLVSSASKRNILVGPPASDKSSAIGRVPVQVFDEAGNDVTPLPLNPVDPNALRRNQSNILGDGSVGTPSDLVSQPNMSFMTGSAFGGGPFTRSVFTQSFDTTTESAEEEERDLTSWGDIQHKREEVKEILQDEDLEKIVNLVLDETETIWLLDIPGVCVSSDSEEAQVIQELNEKYKELCKSRAGNDLYAERGMNTFNEAPKFKAIQTNKITYTDCGITSSNWEMYDTYTSLENETKKEESEEVATISRANTPELGDSENINIQTESAKDPSAPQINTLLAASSAKNIVPGSIIESSTTASSSFLGSDLFSSKPSGDLSTQSLVRDSRDDERIMKSESLRKDLFVMERVINLNTYQPKLALYRGFGIMPDIDVEPTPAKQVTVVDLGPNLDRLWSYACPLTKGHNVSCLTWNRSNPDLIAVGYGQFEFANQKSGMICCWSPKNPEFPERVYFSKQGVTALDFSVANANLLAVGFYDGGIAVYNVRSIVDEPIIDNQKQGHLAEDAQESHGKHVGPVWQIRWIEKERGSGEERTEVLISISTDGRVTQWSIRKGFESYDIMKLKKMPTRMAGKAREKKGEAFISRHAGGLCFDFHSRDTNVYLAGTEEGYIHKCSCSYNEQYLETFSGHTAPVYHIKWSPFVTDIFLSCSADWSMRLWHQDRTTPILTFHSSTKAVNDISWSPRSSTVFASVNEGAVEVWDLAQSTLDAVITLSPTSGAKLTSVTFGLNTECILVGDSEGQVTVYELRCMPSPPPNQIDALNGIIKASLASQLSGIAGDNNAAHEQINEEI